LAQDHPCSRQSGSRPQPLPHGFLANLARSGPILLCLDYDGTLAEIADDPRQALPAAGAREALLAIARLRERIAIAVVSGREIDEVRRMLRISRGIFFVGVHGIEIVRPDGERAFIIDVNASADGLKRVRAWLGRNVPKDAGFLVEDKTVSIALHFRKADPQHAAPLCAGLQEFVAHEAPRLEVMTGKMVVEAVPRGAGKGKAVEFVRREIGSRFTPVYFGDDVTDEDAFAVVNRDGVTILVGDRCRTLAQYRVDGPGDVVTALSKLAASTDAVEREPRSDGRISEKS
jgi:alpha,alpha-trehalase